MGLLAKLTGFFNSNGANLIDSVADTVDRFVTTESEKAEIQKELMKLKEDALQNERQFRLKVEQLLHDQKQKVENTIQQELEAKKGVIQAELNQGDKYTKRARPTVVYVGLFFIMLEMFGLRMLILDMIFADSGNFIEILDKSNDIFDTFLYAWAGVVGVYALGRSAEKYGVQNRATQMITGSQTTATPNDKLLIESIKDKLKW